MFPLSWYGQVSAMIDGRGGVPLDLKGERQYTRAFLVEVKEAGKHMGPIGVCSHPDLPRPWAYYITDTEYDTDALLVRWEAKPRDSDDWTYWIATATYSTNNNDGNFQAPPAGVPGAPGGLPNTPNTAYSNPEYEWPSIEWNFDEQQKPALVDLDGKPYQNSALQPFTPAVQFPRAYKVLNVTRNELNFNSEVAQAYSYAVNDRVFLGYPPGFVQCMPPKASQLFKGTRRYWKVSYQLKFHPRGIWLPEVVGYMGDIPIINKFAHELNWQPVMQDQGYMRLEDRQDFLNRKFPAFGKAVPIERNGRPISQQVLLDGFGQEAVDKFQIPDPLAGMIVPVYLKYRQFPSKDFTSLANRGFV